MINGRVENDEDDRGERTGGKFSNAFASAAHAQTFCRLMAMPARTMPASAVENRTAAIAAPKGQL